MLKFDEAKIRSDIDDVLSLRPQIEAAADAISSEGYESLILLGIGGTYAAGMELEAFMRGHSSIDVRLENAAELPVLGNTRLNEKAVVLVTSVTGNTPEVVHAVDYAHQKGARVAGFIDAQESPLARAMDIQLCANGGAYFKMLLFALRLMYNRGEYPDYEVFYQQASRLGDGVVAVQRAADGAASAFAKAHCDDAMHYVIGGGNLWGAAYSYAMCYMEEMLWMRTKSISAADFFHGTLEIIERDSNVTIFAGEDEARPLTDRVCAFIHKICRNVTVFDTKDYELPGIDAKFRGILSPVVMGAVYARLNVHLEEERKHPMDIRRYYRRLDY